jgi:AAA15 family ATPase/GTPase
MSSFIGEKQKNEIELSAKFSTDEGFIKCCLFPEDINNIYSDWKDKNTDLLVDMFDDVLKNKMKDIDLKKLLSEQNQFTEVFKSAFLNNIPEKRTYLSKFLIFNLNTQSLRGILNISKEIPLGINGEGLDLLLHDFSKEEWEELREYSYLINWLDDIIVDDADTLKYKGHKLGRSSSFLYFKDKYMRKNNNVFAAENSNEGVLSILFYLTLFISKKTPKFFAIDNIETSLNPKLCRTLMTILADLSIKKNKQALITTHNPAILDGLNLFDDNQRLFVVKRTDEGNTKVERIKLKPHVEGKELKLSEMWMRGYLGGLPNNF